MKQSLNPLKKRCRNAECGAILPDLLHNRKNCDNSCFKAWRKQNVAKEFSRAVKTDL
jgi:hypothetical protein